MGHRAPQNSQGSLPYPGHWHYHQRMKIETERLYLRRFELSDREAIYRLHCEPEIMKFTRKGGAISKEESFENLQSIVTENERDFPLGKWAAFEKADDAFVGWFGFWSSEFNGEPELGFMIAMEKWGQGFATEACRALLAYYDRPRVHAFTTLTNAASQNVLAKLGFEVIGEDEKSRHFIKIKAD